MYKQENSEILALYAISPVHAGSGTSTGVVDLPIQRERHTNWPHIQASGVKGAMRAHFDKFKGRLGTGDEQEQLDKVTERIFGTENYDGESLPGAIAVSDAKILAFPMRSNIAPFLWITCPSVLKRLVGDLKLTGADASGIEELAASGTQAICLAGDIEGKTLLEDYEVDVSSKSKLSGALVGFLKKAGRLLLVSDEVFNYGVENCTDIQTQIKINQEKGTTVDGSLRYEELLPSDSILYAVMMYGDTRDDRSLSAQTLISYMKDKVIKSHIQIGGDETLGRGIFEIDWIEKEAK